MSSLTSVIRKIRRKRKHRTKRDENIFNYFDSSEHPMTNTSTFLGTSTYSDYIKSDLKHNAFLAGYSTIAERVTILASTHHWFEFIQKNISLSQYRHFQLNHAEGLLIYQHQYLHYDISGDTIHVNLFGRKEFVNSIKSLVLKAFKEVSVYIEWVYSMDGQSVDVPLTNDKMPIDKFYPWMNESLYDYYERFINSKSNLLLLIGPPGTGKTAFTRGLLRHANTSALVTYDHEILSKDYFFARFIEDDSNLLILEDCDQLLTSRIDGNRIMEKFLNTSDGLVALPNKKMIFTTNLPTVRDIDPALIRPGRCHDVLKFDYLTRNNVTSICDTMNIPYPEEKDQYVLAEVFNAGIVKKHKSTFGFNQ